MKTERLSSNDSGIDMEELSASKNGDSAANVDKHVENGDKIEGYRTGEKMDKNNVNKCDNNKKKRSKAGKKKGKKERKVSESCSPPSEEVSQTSENIANGEEIPNSNAIESNDCNGEVAENVIQSNENDNGVATGDVDVENDANESKNANIHSEIRTKIGFLEEDLSYSLPNFTHTVFDDIMIVTLEVKNVSEESVEFVCFDKWKSLHLKFVSLGSGHFPIHHAFYLDFLQVFIFNYQKSDSIILGADLRNFVKKNP